MMLDEITRRAFIAHTARCCGSTFIAAYGTAALSGCSRSASTEPLPSVIRRVKAMHADLRGLPQNPVAVAQTERPIMYPYVGDPTQYDRRNNSCYPLLEEALMLLNPEDLDNPLSNVIRKGDVVVIKPNWCTQLIFPIPITHPSLVYAAAELAARAGAGTVRIVEAPMTLTHSATWFYGPAFLNMQLCLRHLAEKYPDTHFEHQDGNADDFVWVSMGDRSALDDIPIDVLCHDHGKITSDMFFDVADVQGYNPVKYSKGLYAIAQSYLDSDVFINFSKMKTHMWTGITIALKNLMGLNVISTIHRMPPQHQKEYLARPDFRWLRECSMRDVPHFDQRYYRFELRFEYNRHNDVLWRSLADLNRIIMYADAKGKIHNTRQRRYLNIVDGVVGTDKAGPVTRSRVYSRTIVAGADPVRVDAVCCRIMGYEPHAIKLVHDTGEQISELRVGDLKDYEASVVCSERPGKMPVVRPYAPHRSWLPDGKHNIYYEGSS